MGESMCGWVGEQMIVDCQFYTKLFGQVETVIVRFLNLH